MLVPHDAETPWWGILLLMVSNFFFPYLKSYRYRLFFQSAVYLALKFLSSAYHLCKPANGLCVLPFETLTKFDFFFAFMNVVLVAHYFLPYSAPIVIVAPDGLVAFKETGLEGKEVISFVLHGILIALVLDLGLLDMRGYAIVVGAALLELGTVLLYMRARFGLWPRLDWRYALGGVGLLAAGGTIFVSQDFAGFSAEAYAVLHSLWHVLSAVGQTFLIDARIFDDDAHVYAQKMHAMLKIESHRALTLRFEAAPLPPPGQLSPWNIYNAIETSYV